MIKRKKENLKQTQKNLQGNWKEMQDCYLIKQKKVKRKILIKFYHFLQLNLS